MFYSFKKPAKAIIFARVSSSNQEAGHSLNAQVSRLQAYCKQKNLEVIKEFQISDNRSQFLEVIDFIKEQKTKIVLACDSIDRLQRGFRELTLIDELVKNDKIEIYFVKNDYYLNKNSSATDFLRWNMSALFTKSYVSCISDNVKRSFACKLHNGEWIGKAPFGYKNITLDNGRKNVIIDEAKSLIVKEIFNLYSAGESLTVISEKFDLSKNIVDTILKNPFYCGKMYIKKYDKYYSHKYERLISQELFDKCQEIRTSKKAVKFTRTLENSR